MPTLELTDQHGTTAHPDYLALTTWLTDNRVNLLWIRVPSTITITDDEILTEEYERDGDVIRMTRGPDNEWEPVYKRGRYPLVQPALPRLQFTRVTR